MGSILCNFFLIQYPKVTMKMKKQGYVNRDHEMVEAQFKEINEIHFNVDIKFSLLGIRNLINEAIKPIVEVRLTSGKRDHTEPK